MKISIDKSSGFCWGVVRTIDIVENQITNSENNNIYILGQIIHNPREVERLEAKGLKTISRDDFPRIANENAKVIIRAHGEPPQTYSYAKELGIELVDATCPLVTRLQENIHKKYTDGWQIVIFGKKTHAEVIGLRGVVNDTAIVIESVEDAMEKVDFSKKTILFSQTTMDKPTFYAIKEVLSKKAKEFIDANDNDVFDSKDTICKFVSGREEDLKQFCTDNDVVLFVAGRNSSNGKSLYAVCKTVNERVFFIEDANEIDYSWFNNYSTIGITGATSTPQWYMEKVKSILDEKFDI